MMVKVKYWLLAMLLCMGQAGAVCAQDLEHDISGTWYGVFSNYMGEKQRLLVVLEKDKHGYHGQLRSPDKTDVALPMDSVTYAHGILRFRINEIGLAYKGGWDAANHRFNGHLQQSGDEFPLNISKDEIRREALYRRPQDPQPPFDYRQEEVMFSSQDPGIALAGAFTRPADSARRYPAVILLSDAGPQNRNEEMLGHKPFAVLADYLTRKGIAVLRYDDRGAGASSGNYEAATLDDQAADVRAAIAYLRSRKDVDAQHIGLLGQGEGAAVAQIAAAGNDSVAFVVSMAGPGLSGRQLQEIQLMQVLHAVQGNAQDSVIQQNLRYAKPWFDLLTSATDPAAVAEQGPAILQELYRHIPNLYALMSEQRFVEASLAAQATPHRLSVIQHRPAEYLAKIRCPFLAVSGAADVQLDAGSNLQAIEQALLKGGNQQVTVRSFEGLNHLFQRCKTCRIDEYSSLDQTIDPAVLEFISRWMAAISSL
ncbi:alpha/beta hydrolase family protein [Chitinophaga japonensis]|uniref:Serine aminopeptidase S33 domain-containing protein n=1 Tax=Chitinophaga japonensis TaxID=104662 RepID=A0A562T7M0_CHIJA|nr:alpha/beta hydrolase [Chitinophaga japonensis]TWI88910.1 hypothetical protein LX66_3000 [Chitinophaga japonensis]